MNGRKFRVPQSLSRRRFLQSAGILALAAGCGRGAAPKGAGSLEQMIVLGIDGMDPTLLEQFIAAGRMPNCKRLRDSGSLQKLATSLPPQSPVAWSNFISGTNPGGHGIFDFIARNPATMQPYHSTARLEKSGEPWRLGQFVLPSAPAKMQNLRKGATFWNELERRGVDCTVFRIPANFPPTEGDATTLSGMGTPDLQGGYGSFTFLTDAPDSRTHDVPGGRIERIKLDNHQVTCRLDGPYNEFSAQEEQVKVAFEVVRDPEQAAVKITIQNQTLILKQGEWSDWIAVRFELLSFAVSVTGICRFYLKSVRDPFSLYISPVNIDPAKPSVPLSTPAGYSKQLVQELGYYYTQGMIEDTNALSAGVLDAGEYRQQALFVHEERLRCYERELARFHKGFLFFYFSTLDLNSHVFWRAIDPGHPQYSKQLAESQGDFIGTLYEKIDKAVGQAMQRLDSNGWLIVMSDHGFGSFRRQFNLNSWLLDNGYLRTSRPPVRDGSAGFQNVDWKRTRAYGLGINSLYLNRQGREVHGMVTDAQADRLARELVERLQAVTDPQTGGKVIARVYRATEAYAGPHAADSPDLIVGYEQNYRASWETILGGFPREHVSDNLNAWSGDHCIDPTYVPGVLLSSRPLPAGTPKLEDLAPTILAAFGAPIPESMTGRRLI
ncbi:MAG: type phosphodiesterase/nucleotide pyrophosphatase [Planctomycetaceae bacterium]|nr:type phosphodiesterase/nucleotide pyrophosphatase [Planctomycetaceae bacterium]